MSASVAARPRSPESIAARRTRAERHARRLGDGVGHHPGQRALAEPTGEEVAHELGLGLGRPGEEVAEQLLAGRDGARARRCRPAR